MLEYTPPSCCVMCGIDSFRELGSYGKGISGRRWQYPCCWTSSSRVSSSDFGAIGSCPNSTHHLCSNRCELGTNCRWMIYSSASVVHPFDPSFISVASQVVAHSVTNRPRQPRRNSAKSSINCSRTRLPLTRNDRQRERLRRRQRRKQRQQKKRRQQRKQRQQRRLKLGRGRGRGVRLRRRLTKMRHMDPRGQRDHRERSRFCFFSMMVHQDWYMLDLGLCMLDLGVDG